MYYTFEDHDEQETRISLTCRDIDAVDSNIGRLRSLKRLGLGINHLEELPETIGHLEDLEIAFLSHNRLCALPDTIGNLKSLQKLFLSENQLILLPETIGRLRSLESLLLNDNMLMQLPDTIGDLENLVELWLNGNELTLLPETMGRLRSLEYLNIRGNGITMLPVSMGHMENLRVLDLSGNQLASLPDGMGMLRRLVYLNLRNNQLTLLPGGMRELSNSLGLLDLQGNSISSNGDGPMGRSELRAVFGDRVVLDGDVARMKHEVRVKDVYRKLRSKRIHWNFDETRRLRPFAPGSEHTEESLMEVWRSISEHTTEENRRTMEEFMHSQCSSLWRNVTGATLGILSGGTKEVVSRTVGEICEGLRRCSIPAYVMVSVYHQLTGPTEDHLRNVFETVIGCEKEMMFDASISQDSFQRDLQMYWRHRLRDEIGLDSDGDNVIDKYGVKALDRFQWPGNVLDVFYSMFTPSHVASVLTDLVNSSDRTVCETLELLHGDPIGHTIADGRTLVTEEQTRHLLTRMGITVTRPFLHRCFGGVSSVLRKMATCDWCSSPFE